MRDVKIKKYNKKFDYTYAFGMFPTIELLTTKPSKAIKVLLNTHSARSVELERIIYLCKKNGVRFEFNNRQIEKIAVKENTYAIGIFEKFGSTLSETNNHIALVNPSDMGNVGTIIRTMLGFGISDMAMIRPAIDIFDPRVVRSSMGGFFKINFEYFDSFEDYMDRFETHNLYSFMLDAKSELHKVKFNAPFSMIFGNEGDGLPESYKNIGESVHIKHNDKIDSLNLSVAVGIALYESLNA